MSQMKAIHVSYSAWKSKKKFWLYLNITRTVRFFHAIIFTVVAIQTLMFMVFVKNSAFNKEIGHPEKGADFTKLHKYTCLYSKYV